MFEIRGAQNYPEMTSAAPLYDQMAEAIRKNNLDFTMPIERANYAPWIIHTPAPGSAAVQLTHAYKMNSLNPTDLTDATTECRRQAHGAADVLKHIPGLEDCELIRTAPHIGVREARRICGKYHIELEDLAAGRAFEDAVASCAFVVDIHNPDPESTEQAEEPRSKPYEIPYRCMVPEDRRGLLVAGRCISGSHEAHASYRVTGTAMALGQAAGMAAAWSVRDKTDVSEIDGKALRRELAQRGAQFLDSGISKS